MPDFTSSSTGRPPSPADDPAFLQRVAAYLDQTLPDADLEALQQELEADDSKRQAFALICLGDSLAFEEFTQAPLSLDLDSAVAAGRESDSDVSMHDAQVMPALRDAPEAEPESIVLPKFTAPNWTEKRRATTVRRLARNLGIAAVIALVAFAGYQFLRPQPTVAVLAEVASAKWDGAESPSQGSRLRKGQELALISGFAKLRCDDGAEVTVEGPARFTIAATNGISLHSGRVWVRMISGTSGFEIKTPTGTITDLGTEFGVNLGGDGVADVHVFKGKVRIAPSAAASGSREVAAGDAARLQAGAVSLTIGGVRPQQFVRDISRSGGALELVDLLSGGDGLSGSRGGIIDQTSGQAAITGAMDAGGNLFSDGVYHAVPQLNVIDGAFMPDRDGRCKVDSAGHFFNFPATQGKGTVRICTGGTPPILKNGTTIYTQIGGIDYAVPGHSYIFIHPNAGVTFDLAAIRRLHPQTNLVKFRSIAGSPMKSGNKNKADIFVLVDGVARFSRKGIVAADGTFTIDIPLTAADRFLTLATTDGGDGVGSDQVLIADPVLDVSAAP